MPFILKISYAEFLKGEYTKKKMSIDPFGRYFYERGADVIRRHIYAPEIDCKSEDHVNNIIHLLTLAKEEGYEKVTIKLEEQRLREKLISNFCKFKLFPGILVAIVDRESSKAKLKAVFSDKYDSYLDYELAHMTNENITKLLDEAKARIEQEQNTENQNNMDTPQLIGLTEIENNTSNTIDDEPPRLTRRTDKSEP